MFICQWGNFFTALRHPLKQSIKLFSTKTMHWTFCKHAMIKLFPNVTFMKYRAKKMLEKNHKLHFNLSFIALLCICLAHSITKRRGIFLTSEKGHSFGIITWTIFCLIFKVKSFSEINSCRAMILRILVVQAFLLVLISQLEDLLFDVNDPKVFVPFWY